MKFEEKYGNFSVGFCKTIDWQNVTKSVLCTMIVSLSCVNSSVIKHNVTTKNLDSVHLS